MKNLKYAIDESEMNVRRTADDLREAGQYLGRKLERMVRDVQALLDEPVLPDATGLNLNCLGVIQGAGPALDVLCGKLEVELKFLAELRRIRDGLA